MRDLIPTGLYRREYTRAPSAPPVSAYDPTRRDGRNNRPVGAGTNANVLIQLPIEPLRPFVKRFVVVEFPGYRKLKLLPDTGFVAEFRFRGEPTLDGNTNLPRAVISGLWDTARTRAYT